MVRVIGDRIRLDANDKRMLAKVVRGANIDNIKTVSQLNALVRAAMKQYMSTGSENKLMRHFLASLLVEPTEVNGNVAYLKKQPASDKKLIQL